MIQGWVGAVVLSTAISVLDIYTLKRHWLFLVPPKAQVLRKLSGTMQVLAVALPPLRGCMAGWLGHRGGAAGGSSLRAGFREAPEQTWCGCRKSGPWSETKCGPDTLWSPRGP